MFTNEPFTRKKDSTRRKTLLLSLSLMVLFSLLLTASMGASASQPSTEPASSAELAWHTEFVDKAEEFKNMTDRSLKLDAEGHPHIVFGGDQLNYAEYDGDEWHISVVDAAAKVGQYAALALAEKAVPHISYYDAANGDLKYAHWTGSQWVIQTIDSGGDVGLYTSIVLHDTDESGSLPRISYYDATNTNLKDAYFTGTQWIIEVIDASGDVGRFSSLALDNDGIPHISYYDDSPANELALKYAYWDKKAQNGAGGWVTDTVDPNIVDRDDVGVGSYASLAVRNDKVHIAYYDQVNQNLKYASGRINNWEVEVIDSGEHVGKYNSIAVDVDQHPHISYFNEYSDDLKYVTWTGDKWVRRTIDDEERVGMYTSIALTGGNPRISYYDITNRSIKYASFTGSTWTLRTVYRAGSSGQHSSIALDSNGNPHISYYYAARNELRYASWYDNRWWTMLVDTDGNTGKYSSLAIDSREYPHISYYDESDLELKYAAYMLPGAVPSGSPRPSIPLKVSVNTPRWPWTARTNRTSATMTLNKVILDTRTRMLPAGITKMLIPPLTGLANTLHLLWIATTTLT